MSEEIGNQSALLTTWSSLFTDVESIAGNHAAAEAEARSSVETLRVTGGPAYASTRAVQLADLLLDRGDTDAAEPWVDLAEKKALASDVLVQFCSVTTYYKNIDVNGNPSKYTHTIGHGRAVMFRGGKRVSGTWYRKYYNGGTQFRTAAGADMVFRPGQVWVVLVANNAPLG